jgi:tetratricopeptide (TPR) repeat protein
LYISVLGFLENRIFGKMDKSTLLELLNSPESISHSQAELLEELTQKYSYFSLPHLLIAKYQYQQQSSLAPQKIRKAALYAYNRAMLKKMLVSNKHESNVQIPDTMAENIKTAGQEAKSFFQNLKDEMDEFDKKISEATQEDLDKELSTITSSYTLKNYFDDNTVEDKIKEEYKNETQKEQNSLIDSFLDFEMPKNVSNSSENLFEEILKEQPKQEINLQETSFFDSIQIKEPNTLENEAIVLVKEEKFEEAIKIYNQLLVEQPSKINYYGEQKAIIEKEIQNRRNKSNTSTKTVDQILGTFNTKANVTKTPEKVELVVKQEEVKPEIVKEPIIQPTENIANVTEADAMALFGEGKIQEAVEIYRKLMLQFPEKKSYFVSQIEILES